MVSIRPDSIATVFNPGGLTPELRSSRPEQITPQLPHHGGHGVVRPLPVLSMHEVRHVQVRGDRFGAWELRHQPAMSPPAKGFGEHVLQRREQLVPARPTGGSDLHDAGGGEGDDLPAQLLVHGLGELEVLLVDALEEDDPLR